MKWDIDHHRQITELDFQSPILAEKKPINRFVAGSTLLHILSASAIFMLGQIPQPKPELVEIEFTSAPIAPIASAPTPAPIVQEAAPAPAIEKEVTPVVAQKPVPSPAVAKATAPVPKAAPAPAPKFVPVAQTVDAQSEPETPKPQPAAPEPVATIDDIETPTLDDSEVAAIVGKKPDHPKVSKKEVEEKLAQAEKLQSEKAALIAQNMQDDANATDSDINDKMNEAASAVEAQNAEAAAEAEARTQAIRDAQAAQAAKAADAAAAAKLTAQAQGEDTQSAGAGKSGELRALDQLRQMPGNPKPQYDPQERLQGHNGNVIFKAFVTNDGQLKDFEMLQSTGHRNLDLKTLKALKQWKFYPGQQGWVELPFKWDLKGGPQEMPTLLRRRVGQN